MLILNFTYPLRCLRVPPVEYRCSRPLKYSSILLTFGSVSFAINSSKHRSEENLYEQNTRIVEDYFILNYCFMFTCCFCITHFRFIRSNFRPSCLFSLYSRGHRNFSKKIDFILIHFQFYVCFAAFFGQICTNISVLLTYNLIYMRK
jgi:hypothetical protein